MKIFNKLKKKIMAFRDIFKDSNDLNEKTIVGFSSFAIMALFAIADIISGALGKDLVINYRASVDGLKFEKYTPSFGTTLDRITIFEENPTANSGIKNSLQNIYSNKNDTLLKNPYNLKRRFF